LDTADLSACQRIVDQLFDERSGVRMFNPELNELCGQLHY
jgi:hypothetical protein